MDMLWLAFTGIVFFAYTMAAITGFGSTIIALSLGALWLPIDKILPILVCLNVYLAGFFVVKNFKYIDWSLLKSIVLPGMLLGTLLGYLAKPLFDEVLAKQLFGLLIIWFSARELWRMARVDVIKAWPLWRTRLVTLGAGITHGMFASGGPLLVYALAGSKVDKTKFRASLAFIWLLLNVLLALAFLLDGRLMPVLPQVLWYLPLIFVAIKLGDYLHKRVPEQVFRQAIYSLLLVTGVILVISRYLS